jgi:hypothetical protein
MQPLPDFPEHVERTQPIRQRHLQVLAFDVRDDELEWKIRDVIEELEYLVDVRATMSRSEFREAVIDQARRLTE